MSRSKVLSVLWIALVSVVVADAPRFGPWSAPANLGPVVNYPGKTDYMAALSRDGLSLYFSSGRVGVTQDIYVSQRASLEDPFGPPVNLGANINRPGASWEQAPVLSPDGHRLYFASNREGGFGSYDIWVCRRHDERDDFGWEPAENLGPLVNSEYNDEPGGFFEDQATGTTTFYLTRLLLPLSDIFESAVDADGTIGAPVAVDSLNTADREQFPTVRRDGLEIIFASDRPGSIGDLDLWVAVRDTVSDPWSAPQPLEGCNTAYIENHPRLSFDGTELYFTSTRPQDPPVPGAQQDLYLATRERQKGRPQ